MTMSSGADRSTGSAPRAGGPTRLVVVDDHQVVRDGFAGMLDTQTDFAVVGTAADGAAAIRLCAAVRPDVVLMDVRMAGVDGIQATRELTAMGSGSPKVLILTTFDLDEYAFSGLQAGASGFLLKDVLPADLLAGIRAVASGDAVIAPSTTRRLLDTYARRLPIGGDPPGPPRAEALTVLTERERGVFAEIAAGLSNSEIAAKLVLSEATVKTHVGHILAKLGLRDRVQAVIFAYDNGIARPSS